MSNLGHSTSVLERSESTSVAVISSPVNRSNQTVAPELGRLGALDQNLYVETEEGSSRTNLTSQTSVLANSIQRFLEGLLARPSDISKVSLLLAEPVGTPFTLTKEEALEVINRMFGSRKDSRGGAEIVRDLREQLGTSIMTRSDKTRDA